MKKILHLPPHHKLYTVLSATFVSLGFLTVLPAYAQDKQPSQSAPTIQVIPPTEPITEPHPAPKPKEPQVMSVMPANKDRLAPQKPMTPGQEIAKKEQLKLSPEEKRVMQELFETTLKPLTLERIDFDMKLLTQHKVCVEKSKTAQEFRDCDFDFLQARREKSEELMRKIETKRIDLDKKYNAPVKSKNEHPFFELHGK